MKKKSPQSDRLNRRGPLGFWVLALFLTLGAVMLYAAPLPAATIHVPADYPTIQAAVAAASPGDTIEVAAGSYAVSGANINKALTLKGAQAGVDARDGRPAASESIITTGGLGVFSLNAAGITFDGFKFTNMVNRTIDTTTDADNFTMRNCILQGNVGSYSGGAIQFGGPDTLHANGLFFEQNLVTADNGYFFYMGHAMDNGTIRNNTFPGDSVSFGPFGARTGWLIEGNEFDGNVTGHGAYWGFGFNANLGNVTIQNNYVHQMNLGFGQISVVGGTITANTFEDNQFAAFQLWGGEFGTVVSTNVTITCNTIKYNGATNDGTPSGGSHGIRLRPTLDASTIHLHNNNFINLGVGTGSNVWAIRQNGSGTADAENNWWGTTDSSVIATKFGQGAVDYTPFLTALSPCAPVSPPPLIVYVDDDWVGTTPGTDPDGGAGPAANFGFDSFATIQDGINGVAAGGTVIVYAGNYTVSGANITKAVTLNGAKVGVDARRAGRGTGESIILGSGFGTFQLSAANITFDGFTFTNLQGREIDSTANADNFHMLNCILEGSSIDPGYNTGAIQFGGPNTLHAHGLLFEQNLVTADRSEEHTSELQSRIHLVCRLLLEKKQILRTHPKRTPAHSTQRTTSCATIAM